MSRRRASLLFFLTLTIIPIHAIQIHHMRQPSLPWVNRRDSSPLFKVTNYCPDDIYPAIETTGGTGPGFGGFHSTPGTTMNFTVSADWRGRIWARTNCSFNADGTGPAEGGGLNGTGRACLTGDCGGVVDCQGSGQPASLAEFNLVPTGETFYDISLVDGYNLPMGIVSLHPESNDPSLAQTPSNTTNPICIGSPNFLTEVGSTMNTSMTYIDNNNTPLESSLDTHAVSRWCPWPLQMQPPRKPGEGIYPYPDDAIPRPDFDPCLSSCSMYGRDWDCCAGKYNDPSICQPNLYSRAAKKVCPDAYGYAYDDKTSTFTIKSGAGFEVVFCPSGRSTNIKQQQALTNQDPNQNQSPDKSYIFPEDDKQAYSVDWVVD